MILFTWLEKLDALGRKNSLRSMSEIKTEFDAKEALGDEKVATLESKLQKILDEFPVESSTKPCTKTLKWKPRDKIIPATLITRQQNLTLKTQVYSSPLNSLAASEV